MTRFLTSAPALLAASSLLLTATLSSCFSLDEKPSTCTADTLAPITRLSSVKTGTVGTPLEVYYSLQIANGCGQFKSLEEKINGNNIYLSPLVRYEGCACPEVITDYNGTYKFTASQPGKYVVHFLKADYSELTDTLTVR